MKRFLLSIALLYLIGDIDRLGGMEGYWMKAFVTGFFQGSAYTCPMMTGSILHAHLSAVISNGRATPDLDMRVVLHQLLREAGCTLPASSPKQGA